MSDYDPNTDLLATLRELGWPPGEARGGLSSMLGLLLLGRLAELRQASLVQNLLPAEQATALAYSEPLSLPVAARRSTLLRSGSGVEQDVMGKFWLPQICSATTWERLHLSSKPMPI